MNNLSALHFTFTIIESFKNAMLDTIGYAPEHIQGDGILHRFNGPNGKLNGAYVLYLDNRPAGYYQCFKQNIKEYWKSIGQYQPLSDVQRRQYAIDRQRQEVERQQQKDLKHRQAAAKALRTWNYAEPAKANHPYLINKRVDAHKLRLGRNNTLIMPIYDENKKLVNLQFISESGDKKFLSGGKKKACFSVIGNAALANFANVLICEGYATGASLHQSTGNFTVIALDAGNLKTVAIVIKKLYPDSQIIICGDNDLNEVGQKAAKEAALAIGGKYIIPATVGHDWNDALNMEVL